MEERQQPLGDRRLSRRKLLEAAGAGVVIAAVKGVRLEGPPIVIQTITVNGGGGEVQLISTDSPEIGNEGPVNITPEGKLKFETSDQEFFYPGREYQYIHRANDLRAIDKAWDKGAEVFDIDANSVAGTIYAGHGIVPQLKVGLGRFGVRLVFPAIFDVNEKEVRLGMPSYTYEQLIARIAELSSEERPLAASTELKRGEFDAETLITMLDIHRHYNVPVLIHSPRPRFFETNGGMVASVYSAMGQ